MGKKAKPEITDFTPETITNTPTREDQLFLEFKNKMQMFAAVCDREIQRIATEHGVRIGDSQVHEKSLCDAITEVLEEHRDFYLESIK